MGVHGLTTYLRAHSASLAYLRELHSECYASFVIDGWSFIYEVLALLDLPWVYGGEYNRFSEAITNVVQAWLSLGINLYFVFDGPYPELKFPTIISRTTQNTIKPSLLFFRTSPISRSKPSFLRESAMLPPRAYSACIQTLQSIISSLSGPDKVLEMHFADEEGDPYAVELAARLNAYVLGKDSDFVILNAEGYHGYVPLDEIIWSLSVDEPSSVSNETDSTLGDDDDGFQTVVNSKSKRKHHQNHLHSGGISGHGILPPPLPSSFTPSPTSELSLTITIYTPSTLASHLSIPLSLLPLLAALVGNDFTNDRPDDSSHITPTTNKQTNLQWLFFDHRLSLIQRITRVSSTLHSILKAAVTPSSSSLTSKTKIKEKNRVSSVMELIDRAVGALIVRNIDHLGSGERERVVERVVEATLQYAISAPRQDEGGGENGGIRKKWASEMCAVHEEGTCPLVLLRNLVEEESEDVESHSSTPSSPHTPSPQTLDLPTHHHYHHQDLQKLYTTAYRSGTLSPSTLNILHTGTFWYRLFLENPDLESVVVSFGRPVMSWVYAILDDVFGIPGRVEESVGEEGGGGGNVGGGTGTGTGGSKDEEQDEDEDEDELIDVVEESDTEEENDPEDPLAPLRGALQQLNHTSSSPTVSGNGTSTSEEDQKNGVVQQMRRKVVEEYVRRGTRLKVEEVEVLSLSDLLADASLPSPSPSPSTSTHRPIAFQPLQIRLYVLLHAIGTPLADRDRVAEALRRLPAERRVPVLTLRAVLWRLRERVKESSGGNGNSGSGREREREKWTREEGRAFLASFDWSSSSGADNNEKKARAEDDEEKEKEEMVVPITDRNVQLTAQVLATTDAIERLAECLFLSSFPPSTSPLHSHPHLNPTNPAENSPNELEDLSAFLPPPSIAFSGRTFHTYLTHLKPLPSLSPHSVGTEMWDAVCLGLDADAEGEEGVFGEGVEKKRRKKKEKEKGKEKSGVVGGKKSSVGGKFGLLAVE